MLCLSVAAIGLTVFSLNAAAVPLASPGTLESYLSMPYDTFQKLINFIRSHRIPRVQSTGRPCGRLGITDGSRERSFRNGVPVGQTSKQLHERHHRFVHCQPQAGWVCAQRQRIGLEARCPEP